MKPVEFLTKEKKTTITLNLLLSHEINYNKKNQFYIFYSNFFNTSLTLPTKRK